MKRIFKSILYMMLAAPLLVSCTDREDDATLYFEEPTVTVGPETGTVSVILRSNTQWRIETGKDWFGYNIEKGASNASIVFSFGKNETGAVRSKVISAATLDGSESASFVLKQLPAEQKLSVESRDMQIEADPDTYDVTLTTDVEYGDIEVEIVYADDDVTGWVTNTAFADGKLRITVIENETNVKRVASVNLYHMDEFGREYETSVLVTQMFSRNAAHAEAKSIDYAKTLEPGEIAENIYVTGVVVAAGKGADHNYKANRYIVQDDTHKSLVFESAQALDIALDDKIDLWLLGAEMESRTEAGVTFRALTKVADVNIMARQAGAGITSPEISIGDITDEHLNTLVTLKDVEVAVPYGTWCNYNKYYVRPDKGGYGMALTRFHPTGIRDIKGDFMYASINTEWKYAYSDTGGSGARLPKGSGTLTGIVVREINSNMGDIGNYQIRPRWADPAGVNDIGIAEDRASGFSGLLVEWNCQWVVGYEGMQYLPASDGDQKATAKLFKSNSVKLTNITADRPTAIYFINDYRDGDNATSTGTVNAQRWGTDVWWIMYDINTTGITGALSLQIESNGNPEHGPKNFIVEYSLDGGSAWSPVPNSGYVIQGQTTGSYMNVTTYSPGFKCYNFRLPSALNNQSSVQIRLRPTNRESVNITAGDFVDGSTNRLAHVSIKYNKN